jgi:hypothetical protein
MEKISVNKRKYINFYDNHLEWPQGKYFLKDESVQYSEIQAISFGIIKNWKIIFFIPVSTSKDYLIYLWYKNKRHSLYFDDKSFFKNSQKQKESESLFLSIVNGLEKYVKIPLLKGIFDDYNKSSRAQLGPLKLDNNGLTVNRGGSFIKNLTYLPWQKYYGHSISSGYVSLFEKFDNKKGYRLFYGCPLTNKNSPLIPEIINNILKRQGINSNELKRDLVGSENSFSPTWL